MDLLAERFLLRRGFLKSPLALLTIPNYKTITSGAHEPIVSLFCLFRSDLGPFDLSL